jgi:hypothetical protein
VDGLKVTLIVQELPAATELPQLLLSAKLEAFVPEIVTLVMLNAAFPVFFSVTVFAALVVPTVCVPKARLVAERLAARTAAAAGKQTVQGGKKMASVLITASRIAGLTRSGRSGQACLLDDSLRGELE